MATARPDLTPALLPDDVVAETIVTALQAESIAAQVATVITTNRQQVVFPRVTGDLAATWVPEAQPITLTDLDTDELVVKPEKLVAATRISNEALEDTDPAAATLIAGSIARTLADKLDAAVFGAVPAPAPAGLGRLAAGFTAVGATDVKDLDAWHAGIAAVRNAGAVPTAILVGVGTHLRLTTARENGQTTTRRNLLQPDPTSPTVYAIGGVPIMVSRHVPDTASYVVPGALLRVVIRQAASLEVDRSVFALSRESLVLGECRVGFGVLHDAAVAKITVNP